MPNIKGEYIVPVYTWSDDQTAIDKGYAELIRCKECRYFRPADDYDQCALWDYGKTDREAFCSYAMRRGEE